MDEEQSPLLAVLAGLARTDAMTAAARYRAVFLLAREWEDRYGVPADQVSNVTIRALRAEVAAVMSVPESTAGDLLATADTLTRLLPGTLAALGEGRFSDRHARVIVTAAKDLPAEVVPVFEAAVLPSAAVLTAPKLTRRVQIVAARLHPRELIDRHVEAFKGRSVWLEPETDGMAVVCHRTSAVNAVAVLDRVTRIAKSRLQADGEMRTMGQISSDVLSDLLLDDGVVLPADPGDTDLRQPKLHRGIRPQVHVTVPVLTAIGRSDQPGELEGYGPIDAETARRVAGTASGFFRILTDPETGVALSVGRSQYEVPASLRRYLQVRDGTCRFVGCNRQAKYSDVDHTVAWQDGGETCAANLAHLCRGHHRMKHATEWRVEQSPGGGGVLDWRSPSGGRFRTEPRDGLGRGVPMTEWAQRDAAPF
jgi:hypothetical protein